MISQELIKKIQEFTHPEPDMDLTGIIPTDNDIENAEKTLGVKFDIDYIDFIKIFGGAYAGIQIFAFGNEDSDSIISSETVVTKTKMYREDFDNDERATILRESYVISDDGSGNPIIQTPKKQIMILYHDSDEVAVLANDFVTFISKALEGDVY